MKAQCIRAINVWRKENGMKLLPEVQLRKVDRLATEIMGSKLAADLSAPDDQTRSRAIEDILNLGVGALPAVLEAIETTPKDGEANAQLRVLAKKLSCTVTMVTIEQESAAINEDLKERLDAFEGKPLAKEQWVDLLLFFANELPEGSTGINISVHRTNANSGIEMSVGLTTQWPAYNGSQKLWNTSSSFMVNGNKTRGSISSWSLEYAGKRESYSDFLKTVDTVPTSPQNAAEFNEIEWTLVPE